MTECKSIFVLATGYRCNAESRAKQGSIIVEHSVDTVAKRIVFNIWDNNGVAYGGGVSWDGREAVVEYVVIGII